MTKDEFQVLLNYLYPGSTGKTMLANALGVDASTVRRWATGDSPAMVGVCLRALARLKAIDDKAAGL
jgi:hypothetical protein